MRPSAAALLLAVTCAAWAQDDALRAQVEQRVRLTARLIADPATAHRILASGEHTAISHFNESRVHQSLAEDRLARGDLAGARRAAEVALSQVSIARRMVPDAGARQAVARHRYEQKLFMLERMLESWRAHIERGVADTSDMIAVVGLLGTARQMGGEGRYDDANSVLDTAEWHVLIGMNRLLNARTLDYTARPSSPAQEFQFELARRNSLADLLPLALRELKPAPTVVAQVERYQQSSKALLAQALQSFDGGNTAQALTHLGSSIQEVQRALAAAGVTTPQATGNPP